MGLFGQEQALSFLNIFMRVAQQTHQMAHKMACQAEADGKVYDDYFSQAAWALGHSPREASEISKITANMQRIHPEIQRLFTWLCQTYAGLRYGEHGMFNVKFNMPSMNEFLQNFYFALGQCVPFSTARFGQDMKWPEQKLVIQDVIRAALERTLGDKVQVVDPGTEDVLPGDSVSQVGLSPQLLHQHMEQQSSQSEVSRVQTYPEMHKARSEAPRSEAQIPGSKGSVVSSVAPSRVSVARSEAQRSEAQFTGSEAQFTGGEAQNPRSEGSVVSSVAPSQVSVARSEAQFTGGEAQNPRSEGSVVSSVAPSQVSVARSEAQRSEAQMPRSEAQFTMSEGSVVSSVAPSRVSVEGLRESTSQVATQTTMEDVLSRARALARDPEIQVNLKGADDACHG